MYRIRRWLKVVERDDFEDGCVPGSGRCNIVDLVVEAETVSELQRKIADLLDVDHASIQLNSCGEPGRIDVDRQEDALGNTPSPSEYKQWRAGKTTLYAAIYSATVERVESAGWLSL